MVIFIIEYKLIVGIGSAYKCRYYSLDTKKSFTKTGHISEKETNNPDTDFLFRPLPAHTTQSK